MKTNGKQIILFLRRKYIKQHLTGFADLVNRYGWGKGLYILIYSLVLLI